MRYQVDESAVAWRIVDNEAVLLHADSSAYFGLNRSGTALWTRLAEAPHSAEELAQWARSAFPGAPDPNGSVASFLEELEELQLVQRHEAPGPSPVASAASPGGPWESPAVERFGELEKLILSGE